MKKTDLEPLFDDTAAAQIWVSSDVKNSPVNMLITVSSNAGEQTAFIGRGKKVATKAKYFVQTPPERVITKKDIRNKKIKRALTGVGYIIAIILMCFSSLSFMGILKARIVLTGSMVPTINPGDIIITAKPTQVVPHIGSIVAYTAKRFDGTPVGVFSHRIIGGDAQTGFVVKGDANPLPDVQKPKIPDINGVVVFVIPFIGKIANIHTLMVVVPTLVGLWMVIEAVREKEEDEGSVG
jgi:signal peptidase I